MSFDFDDPFDPMSPFFLDEFIFNEENRDDDYCYSSCPDTEATIGIRVLIAVSCLVIITVNVFCVISAEKLIKTMGMVILAQREKLEQLNREKKS